VDEKAPAGGPLERLKREAAACLADGRAEDARVRYAEAMRLSPQDLEARNGLVRCTVILGHTALAQQQPARAVSHFQLALELSPFHPEADAGLREAAKVEGRRSGADPMGAAFEAFPPVKVFRDLQVADRVVGKVAGARPTQMIKQTLEARREGLAKEGAPPREKRIEHELARAWRRRWFYRAVPVAIVAASIVLWVMTGALALVNWGLILGGFAALWDWMFVERGAAAAARLPRP
jgi:tetratricopeptide (TPR) repeat protein